MNENATSGIVQSDGTVQTWGGWANAHTWTDYDTTSPNSCWRPQTIEGKLDRIIELLEQLLEKE